MTCEKCKDHDHSEGPGVFSTVFACLCGCHDYNREAGFQRYRFDQGEFADYDKIKKERDKYRKQYKRLKKAIKKNTVKIGTIIIDGETYVTVSGNIFGNLEIDGNFWGYGYQLKLGASR